MSPDSRSTATPSASWASLAGTALVCAAVGAAQMAARDTLAQSRANILADMTISPKGQGWRGLVPSA
jgi:hypothetical protein